MEYEMLNKEMGKVFIDTLPLTPIGELFMNIASMKFKSAAGGWIGVFTAGLLAIVLVGTASAAWFGGGAYDGYDEAVTAAKLGYPQVNNADGATNILDTSAFLNGILLTGGSAPAELLVYWGTSDGGTSPANWGFSTNFGVSGTGPATVQVAVTPATTYYYRFFAVNSAAESGWAPSSATFTTMAPPAINASAGVYPVGLTTVTLHGYLTEIDSADVVVYWGANPNSWSYTNNLGACRQGKLDVRISGLVPGQEYFYQWRASNQFGEAFTPIASFRTFADTAWFSGGGFDGYDSEFIWETKMTKGDTLITIY